MSPALAQCHPGREHVAFGLCEECYRRRRRGQFPSCGHNDNRQSKFSTLCEPCHREAVSKPAKAARSRKAILTMYGLTPEQYAQLSDAQAGRCAICHQIPRDRMHVDHDHDTGAVRGLLCGDCNRGLGLFGDNADRVAAAADYLRAKS